MTKSQKQTYENRKYVKSLIQLGKKEKQLGGVIFRSESPLRQEEEEEEEKRKKKGDG